MAASRRRRGPTAELKRQTDPVAHLRWGRTTVRPGRATVQVAVQGLCPASGPMVEPVVQDASVREAELDVPAVLTATDKLLRALRGPLGGTATWEWGDLLAAVTGRSPFEVMGVVRTVDPQVPVPANAEPRDVAAQLVRLAQALDDDASASRVQQAARLLDPAGGGTPPLPQPTPATPPTATPPATPSPAPAPAPAAPSPPWQPASRPQPPSPQPPPPTQAPTPVHSAPTVLPSGSPDPYRGGLADVDGRNPYTAAPGRRGPARPPRRKRPGPWIGLAVIAFFVLRGCIEGFGGG